MMKEYRRWQIENARQALEIMRVVSISGARQSGKTTLTKQIIDDIGKEDTPYRSLDRLEHLRAAHDHPTDFIDNSGGMLVIDEIQKAPLLMSEIKVAVDNDDRAGQYLITGSANIATLSTINDSLAGRIEHIRLRPLTMGEILGNKPSFLECAFKGKFKRQIKGYDKDKIIDIAFCGGYPEVVKLNDTKSRKRWHRNYLNSLIKRDLVAIEKIRRLDVIQKLTKALFSWSGNYMDKSKMGANLEVSRPTLDAYINALSLLFIFEQVPSWGFSDYEPIKRKSKIFATDSGLMTSILNWERDEMTIDSDKPGKLIETLVFQELSAQIDLDQDYALSQYRDKKGHEIDFLIEKENAGVVGIEVKASKNFSQADFAPLLWFKNNKIKDNTPFRGIVLYTGEETLSLGDGMLAVPIAALWV
jgi:predicted AAA+ superfamily ATPase